ncbi:DUF4163 domain-containing protein [Anaerosporobacter faecicola]|uniref:DUF4163 domain-containing protein n=1 Tax=Anaerosporobacter faecicola TaxID=2718714 RepID=UPI00143BDF56|nr:DUF4163 domain-containing protein [Anaerosporobacter faecicola]
MKNRYGFIVILLLLLLYCCYSSILDEKNETNKHTDTGYRKEQTDVERKECYDEIDVATEFAFNLHYEEFSRIDNATHTDIHIEYPQINNMKSVEIEKKVNMLLKEKAISLYLDFDSEGLNLPMKTNIEYCNSNILSVKYSGYGYYYVAINGMNIMYATNIDLNTGEIINIHVLFTERFQGVLNRNVFRYDGEDQASEGESMDPNSNAYRYSTADESIIMEMFENYYNDLQTDRYYFSESGFHLLVITPSGPTIFLELVASYEDLKSCMNFSNGFWDDYFDLQ